MRDKLLIYSGGMDSTVLLNDYKKEIQLAIGFTYGQRHEKELLYAIANCKELAIPYKIIDITSVGNSLVSALTIPDSIIPEGHYTDKSMKQTVVPFRNGIMLSIAAGIAESLGLSTILIATHAGDHTIYPDCRPDFIASMSFAISLGTDAKVLIQAPYSLMSKKDIAIRGRTLNVDFAHTWSCYNGRKLHCGKCGTCVERKEALFLNDPTKYEDVDYDA